LKAGYEIADWLQLGDATIAISNIRPIGCAPSELATGKCINKLQKLAQGFNAALKPVTEKLQKELPGSTILYVNAYDNVMNIINNPTHYGSYQTLQLPSSPLHMAQNPCSLVEI
jgi:phospholipase/lecithinase/hemolysin